MILKQWHGFCLCAEDETCFPPDAQPCAQLFAPLVFPVRRDAMKTRGLFRIGDLSELQELESVRCLMPGMTTDGPLAAFVRKHGACVLNVSFGRAYSVLQAWNAPKKESLVMTLVGLGDVGGTALLALKLLGHEFSKIQIFDPNRAQCERYELELNQILSPDGGPLPQVVICDERDLFACDLFAFTASRGVPGLDSGIKDVRMAQYEANRAMLENYAKLARNAQFTGLFCQISDPVDHLSRAVFLQSNRDAAGNYDFSGLLPEQIQGFGLGVMAARCAYFAKKAGLDTQKLRVFGPHGQGLVCANDAQAYDAALSAELTEQTRTANLRVRALGFKPYLAPAVSSAAVSILQLVRGEAHYGAVPLGGVYFGCRSRMTRLGVELLREALHPALLAELERTHRALEAFEY